MSPNENANIFSKHKYLLIGVGFVLLFFIVAREFNFFVEPSTYYTRSSVWRADYTESRMRYISPHLLSYQVTSLFLLLPGIIFLAMAFSRSKDIYLRESLKHLSIKINISVFTILIALIVAVLIYLLMSFTFSYSPLTDDEGAYLFQAQIFSKGKLYFPLPPSPENFSNVFIILRDGKWCGKYTFGYPLILMFGVLAGYVYLIPILLSMLNIIFVSFLLKEIYEKSDEYRTNLFLILIFFLTSPFYLLTSSTLLSHSFNLLLLVLFLWSTIKTFKTENKIYPILMGITIGWVFNVRQLTAVAWGFPVFIFILYMLYKDFRKWIVKIVLMGLPFLLFILAFFYYNKVITGSYLLTPFNFYDPQEKMGFTEVLSRHYLHTPLLALTNLFSSLLKMNIYLLGWAIPLFFVFYYIFFGEKNRWEKLLLYVFISHFFFYLFYYSPGVSDTGPVYYFELLLPALLFVVKGITLLQKQLNSISANRTYTSNLIPIFVLISILFNIVVFFPQRLIHISNLTYWTNKLYNEVKNHNVHNAVVFIDEKFVSGWRSGYNYCDPELKDDIIYVCDRGDEVNQKLMEYFDGKRQYFRIGFDSEMGKYILTKIND